jgi:hypothetical protein
MNAPERISQQSVVDGAIAKLRYWRAARCCWDNIMRTMRESLASDFNRFVSNCPRRGGAMEMNMRFIKDVGKFTVQYARCAPCYSLSDSLMGASAN